MAFATAWFDAPSLIEGAAMAVRIVELLAVIVVDLRATGMRARLDSDEHAEAVQAAALELRAWWFPVNERWISAAISYEHARHA